MNERAKKIVFIFLFVLFVVCIFLFIREGSRFIGKWSLFSIETEFELPDNLPSGDSAFLPTSVKGKQYRQSHYIFSYAESDRLSEWVAYELTDSELVKAVTRDNKKFAQDKKLPNGVRHYEYRNSGYDRGHLAPAADMAFSEVAMTESFLMSNIAPQLPVFNRGIWSELENKARHWVRNSGKLYVVTGCCWDEASERMRETAIPIPDYYYKALFDTNKESRGMIVFLLPHGDIRRTVFDYAITVDSLERLTAIDFFRQLPDSLEDELESQLRTRLWK